MKSYTYQSIGNAHSEMRFGFAAGEYAGVRGSATTFKAAKGVIRSFYDVVTNPKALWDKSADEVGSMLGKGSPIGAR